LRLNNTENFDYLSKVGTATLTSTSIDGQLLKCLKIIHCVTKIKCSILLHTTVYAFTYEYCTTGEVSGKKISKLRTIHHIIRNAVTLCLPYTSHTYSSSPPRRLVETNG